MKVTAENIDNQQVVLEIEVPADEWGKAINQAVKKVAVQVNIPGFRKGKAPRRILEQHVGQKALLDEAYEIIAPKAFDEAMYILMNGTGVGFSVEQKYTNLLPVISEEFHPTDTTIVVDDSKLGWASWCHSPPKS